MEPFLFDVENIESFAATSVAPRVTQPEASEIVALPNATTKIEPAINNAPTRVVRQLCIHKDTTLHS